MRQKEELLYSQCISDHSQKEFPSALKEFISNVQLTPEFQPAVHPKSGKSFKLAAQSFQLSRLKEL